MNCGGHFVYFWDGISYFSPPRLFFLSSSIVPMNTSPYYDKKYFMHDPPSRKVEIFKECELERSKRTIFSRGVTNIVYLKGQLLV